MITRARIENAIPAIAASGGSTNGVLHMLALARESGVELEIDDFTRSASARRCCATSSRAGASSPSTSSRRRRGGARGAAGGGGLLHEDAPTVTGQTIGEIAAGARETPGQEVIRPLSDPIKRPGAWRSCAATCPEGCVVKLAGHERRHHRGPARVFESEEAAMAAATRRRDRGRRRRRDPQRGPRRRPRHARDARGHRRDQRRRARRARRAADRRALLRRDARLHGRPRRPRGGSRRPDRRRADGDEITIDVDARRIDVALDDAEIAARIAAYTPPPNPDMTGVLKKYARVVSSASQGAITTEARPAVASAPARAGRRARCGTPAGSRGREGCAVTVAKKGRS